MKIIKIDDYQSWYVESDEEAIIIDPWLDKVMQPKSNLFINRSRNENALFAIYISKSGESTNIALRPPVISVVIIFFVKRNETAAIDL